MKGEIIRYSKITRLLKKKIVFLFCLAIKWNSVPSSPACELLVGCPSFVAINIFIFHDNYFGGKF